MAQQKFDLVKLAVILQATEFGDGGGLFDMDPDSDSITLSGREIHLSADALKIMSQAVATGTRKVILKRSAENAVLTIS